MKVAASLAEITVEEFIALNPGHSRPVKIYYVPKKRRIRECAQHS